jgi:hypothetical protein
MEGVMMRGKQHVAMAVRAPDGQILTYEEELPALYRSKWMSIPFLRGVLGLWDSLNLGMRFLTKSSNMVSGEDEQIEGKDLVLAVLLSLGLGVGLFFLLPALVHCWLDGPLGIERLEHLVPGLATDGRLTAPCSPGIYLAVVGECRKFGGIPYLAQNIKRSTLSKAARSDPQKRERVYPRSSAVWDLFYADPG